MDRNHFTATESVLHRSILIVGSFRPSFPWIGNCNCDACLQWRDCDWGLRSSLRSEYLLYELNQPNAPWLRLHNLLGLPLDRPILISLYQWAKRLGSPLRNSYCNVVASRIQTKHKDWLWGHTPLRCGHPSCSMGVESVPDNISTECGLHWKRGLSSRFNCA